MAENTRGRGRREGRGRGRGRKEPEKVVEETKLKKELDENNEEDTKEYLSHEVVEVDGSYGEGGGQVIRNTVSLAALLGKPIRATKIRANRKKPGLAAQHLTGVNLVVEMSKGYLRGGKITSTDITFQPGKIKGGEYEADIKTAGSIGLLIQISLPCMVFAPAPCFITYKGGTNALLAPQTDYLEKVFQPFVKKFGIEFEMEIIKRGFFPKGGGVVTLKTKPVKTLRPIRLESRGAVKSVEIFAFCSGVIPDEVATRMSKAAQAFLLKKLQGAITYRVSAIKEPKDKAVGEGTGVIIIAQTDAGCVLAGSALGERGKRAEDVGTEAAQLLLNNLNHGGCVDEYLQDQIIIFMALAAGVSKVKVGPLTEHTTTSIHFTQLLTGAVFTVSEAPRTGSEETFWIECKGIGFTQNQ